MWMVVDWLSKGSSIFLGLVGVDMTRAKDSMILRVVVVVGITHRPTPKMTPISSEKYGSAPVQEGGD
jgi:hypothetical protein